jgi:hypothetical protein
MLLLLLLLVMTMTMTGDAQHGERRGRKVQAGWGTFAGGAAAERRHASERRSGCVSCVLPRQACLGHRRDQAAGRGGGVGMERMCAFEPRFPLVHLVSVRALAQCGAASDWRMLLRGLWRRSTGALKLIHSTGWCWRRRRRRQQQQQQQQQVPVLCLLLHPHLPQQVEAPRRRVGGTCVRALVSARCCSGDDEGDAPL